MFQVACFWMKIDVWLEGFPFGEDFNQVNEEEKIYIGSWLTEGPNCSILLLIVFQWPIMALIQLKATLSYIAY